MNRLAVLLICALSLLPWLTSEACGMETVVLRASVRLADNSESVLLGDVSDISGPDASTLAGIRLAPAPRNGASVELTVSQIRNLMTDAGVHWGRTSLTGRSVIVRSRPSISASGPAAMTTARIGSAGEPQAPRASRVGSERMMQGGDSSIDGSIAELILQIAGRELQVPASDVRLAVRERDFEFLSDNISPLTAEVQMESNWQSDRVGLTIRLRDADGAIRRTERISLRPLIRTTVQVPSRTVESGAAIQTDDVEAVDTWMSPAQRTNIADADDLPGHIAGRRLRSGEPIRVPNLRSETLVQRGDHVEVRCLVGGIVITMSAEARAAGAEGDVIELRKLGERAIFTATVTGVREVTLDLRR